MECTACGSTENVRAPVLNGGHPVCHPCELIWYDCGITNSRELGEEKRRREAAGEFPFNN